MLNTRSLLTILAFIGFALLTGCSSKEISKENNNVPLQSNSQDRGEYIIGSGDILNMFVWRHPEVSIQVPVRPDGRISTPLVENLIALGKTPSELARDIEHTLAVYIKKPKVTVIVQEFGDGYGQQVRVVGEVLDPQAFRFRQGMSLLDVIIAAGGLTEFSAGNRAFIVRTINNKHQKIYVKLADLLYEGKIESNVEMAPGDILVIPQSWF